MSELQPVKAAAPLGPVDRPVAASGARSAEEIRADLAHCDRDGVPWPEAARRLLVDVPSLLVEVERLERLVETMVAAANATARAVRDVEALCDAADQAGNRIIQVDFEPIKVPWTRAVRVAIAAAEASR